MKYGYAYLAEHCCCGAFSPRVPAQASRRAKALTQSDGVLWVPEALLPAEPSVLDHVFFALKHEGTNLQILSEVLPQIERAVVEARVRAVPNSVPARKIACLWEAFTGDSLEAVPVSARYAGLFDTKRYFTTPGERCRKWRIEFNGLGDFRWCATVEKTPRLLCLLTDDPLARARGVCSRMDALSLDRLQSWSYLAEAKGSFSLEREPLSVGRADRVIRLMKSAELFGRIHGGIAHRMAKRS